MFLVFNIFGVNLLEKLYVFLFDLGDFNEDFFGDLDSKLLKFNLGGFELCDLLKLDWVIFLEKLIRF